MAPSVGSCRRFAAGRVDDFRPPPPPPYRSATIDRRGCHRRRPPRGAERSDTQTAAVEATVKGSTALTPKSTDDSVGPAPARRHPKPNRRPPASTPAAAPSTSPSGVPRPLPCGCRFPASEIARHTTSRRRSRCSRARATAKIASSMVETLGQDAGLERLLEVERADRLIRIDRDDRLPEGGHSRHRVARDLRDEKQLVPRVASLFHRHEHFRQRRGRGADVRGVGQTPTISAGCDCSGLSPMRMRAPTAGRPEGIACERVVDDDDARRAGAVAFVETAARAKTNAQRPLSPRLAIVVCVVGNVEPLAPARRRRGRGCEERLRRKLRCPARSMPQAALPRVGRALRRTP